MTAPTSVLHIRVDKETKAGAVVALDALGLSMSDAVRLFLHRVATDRALPLGLRVPNAETRAAMDEAETIARQHRGRLTGADASIADLEDAGIC